MILLKRELLESCDYRIVWVCSTMIFPRMKSEPNPFLLPNLLGCVLHIPDYFTAIANMAISVQKAKLLHSFLPRTEKWNNTSWHRIRAILSIKIKLLLDVDAVQFIIFQPN